MTTEETINIRKILLFTTNMARTTHTHTHTLKREPLNEYQTNKVWSTKI